MQTQLLRFNKKTQPKKVAFFALGIAVVSFCFFLQKI